VAEDMKIKHGCAFSRDLMHDEEIQVQGIEGRMPKTFMRSALTNIIEARMTEIFEYVRASLKKSGYYEYLNAGAILTGGGALIHGTQGLAQDVLGMDVRIGYPEGISGGMIGELNSPMYATATGLVLRALRDSTEVPVAEEEAKPQPVLETAKVSEEDKTDEGKFLSKIKNWFDQI
jgi:cell division protein FtsA